LSELVSLVARFLIILLLLVVPLQMSYAAAATYCNHNDQAASTSHFGHHMHKHVQPSGDGKLPTGAVDPDCGLCQLGCACIMISADLQPMGAVPAQAALPPQHPLRSAHLRAYSRPPLPVSVA